jgi:hypothetical protein
MTAITPLKIPITVNTSQVAPAMKQVEKTVANSAQRISQIRGAITPALGGLGLGQGASMLGGFTQLGGGAGGAAAAGGALALGMAAPIVVANKYFETMANSTKGASDALRQFNETGRQQYAANSVVLQQYADIEQRAKQIMGSEMTSIVGNFMTTAAGGGAAPTRLEQELMVIKEGYKGISAFLGTLIGGGSMREAGLQEQLTGTLSESEAQRLKMEIAKERQNPSVGAADIAGGLAFPIYGMYRLMKELL